MRNGTTNSPLNHRIPPPFLIPLIGGAMWLVTRPGASLWRDRDLRFVFGTAFLIIGFFVLALGILAFRKARTTIDPVQIERASSVVTHGVFRYTRNPMYVGLTALLVGWGILLANPWTFLGPVAFVLFITRFQIIPEERAMSVRFGSQYDQYRTRVRRWL